MDLAADPHERQNLAKSNPEKTRNMESLLIEFRSRLVPRSEVKVQLSPAERRALASLGYAGGAKAAPIGPAPANLPDTKDMLPFDVALGEAMDLLGKGSVDVAIGRLRAVIRQAPRYTPAYVPLADALRLNSELDEAAEVFLALLAIQPESRDGRAGLGIVLLETGRIDRAIPELMKALEIDPDFPAARYQLGIAFALAGRPEEALAHFNAVLQIDLRHVGARQWRANLLAREGRIAESIADYRKALEYAPDSADTYHNLGITLARTGEVDEARRCLKKAVELSPRSAEFHYALGAFLVRQRQYDEAVGHLARAVELKPGFALAEERLQEARQLIEEQNPKPD